MQKANRVSVFSIALIVFSILGGACATTEKEDNQDGVSDGPLTYEMLSGSKQDGFSPFPSMRPHRLLVKQGEKIIQDRVEYVTYDFNNDGRNDMAQRLDSSGNVLEAAFDFDLDGEIDFKQSYVKGIKVE